MDQVAPPNPFRLEAYDYDLPAGLIAERPAVPRDAARLLVVGDEFADRTIADLPDLLAPGDALVVNDTRVIPARLIGTRGAARIELTLHMAEAPDRWRAFARPAKRLKPGDRIDLAPGFGAEVVAKTDGGEVVLRFVSDMPLIEALRRHGATPLPPYIKRHGADPRDAGDYQTMFAREDGAVAAPTAGLHFTPALTAALKARGIAVVPVTLHVGAGTFLPVKADDIRDHRMHAERGIISAEAAAAINAAARVVAGGTTAVRLPETAADGAGRIRPFAGTTDLFIYPGYRFRAVDLLLTNFHLPRSTLLMLVAAFAGLDRIEAAYAHAIARGYRFYSYGDAMLISPCTA